MTADLIRAKARLAEGGFTCVFVRGDREETDTRRGVSPLLERWETGETLDGFSVADKVVGKAAAMLYVLLRPERLHAGVISAPALAVLEGHGIPVTFDLLAPAIRNRAGDGLCPMEQATLSLTDPADAPAVLRAALAKLKSD